MKLLWSSLIPCTRTARKLWAEHPSVWVDIHSSLFDPKRAHLMYNDSWTRMELRGGLRLQRRLLQRASFQRLWPDALAQPDRLRDLAADERHGDLRDGQFARAVQIRQRAWRKSSR